MSRNHWRNAAVEQVAFPPLTDNITVDLVVIGGGFTGLNAARVAAREGLRVCLIEANSIGHGGSGRMLGWSMQACPRSDQNAGGCTWRTPN